MATDTKNPLVRLQPGELFIGRKPAEVHTILGSCVSVSMFNPRLKVGAICHGRQPARACGEHQCGLKICHGLGDWVSCSVRFMLAYFDQHGTLRRELEVKLFGGARMFGLSPKGASEDPIGKRNVDAAMAIIKEEKLHLMSTDVGGAFGRNLVFDTQTGEVLLKRIKKTINDQ